ncbi:carboxylate-amine ligase [Romeria aff. gracilis LEGE 07310]|uniref:Carboxylate-amine ligase n=1 Tax=Vasconcelosia minhoensis LEGE 07310 TaxID=915328 RepID=A0A8J7DLY5_9CYAN|nr:peptide ligase PGM1-related protein [Romeria gracilis]MBE9077961.1 carboxylate-amine ligase [Romeria aff. gracilis LEGE 07310]
MIEAVQAPTQPAQISESSQFHRLQLELKDRWRSVDEFDRQPRQILVVPSLSLDQAELTKIEGVHHYEERLLFSLIRLRNPETRLVYVTSQPLHPSIVDYYLELLPGIPSSHARNRLELFSTYDASRRPLSEKILDRPRLIKRLRETLNPDQAYMTCFNSTQLEADLSVQLGLPLLAVDPALLYWGTKSGSRQIFAECEIPHPDGSQLTHTAADLAEVTAELWERQPELQRIVIKLNEGFSGEGNALLPLSELATVAPDQASHRVRVEAIQTQLAELRFQCPTETWEHFELKIHELGAIAEAFVEGSVKHSPSVQGRVTPLGEVEILSTHDQMLGGPDGQIFLGCTFPADDRYRLALQEMGRRVGENLAAKGALERYSVDFIAVPQPDNAQEPWQFSAIEINLRKGGTTHPFMALKLLTNGYYSPEDGQFYTKHGQPKYYQASDTLQKESYRGLLPNDLMDIIMGEQLHFSAIDGVGAVFHLMGCLSEYGKLGLTCIGNSLEEAQAIYEQVVSSLDRATADL